MSHPTDEQASKIKEFPKVVKVPDQPYHSPVLLGYDVVAYHQIPAFHDGGVAVRGVSEFAYNFQGYQFWFSSAENRELFAGDPWKYAPAWGGFCSYGVALEREGWPWATHWMGPPASPWEGWLMVNGTLMFNIWADYSDKFMRDEEKNVKLAAERWSAWWGNLHAGPFNTACIGHGPLTNWCTENPEKSYNLKKLPEERPTGDSRPTPLLLGGMAVFAVAVLIALLWRRRKQTVAYTTALQFNNEDGTSEELHDSDSVGVVTLDNVDFI